jgi:predicted transposase YbfD/YdcC
MQSDKQPAKHPLQQLRTHFAAIEDPRVDRTKAHKLLDLITIAVCAVICGAESWNDMEEFGHAKSAFFKRFLDLPNGIPSHDTFNRVFARIQPEQFQTCFLGWVRDLVQLSAGQVVALDGKTLRRSGDKPHGKAPIHMVSAWASENGAGLVLGQIKVEEKSNEITALPVLIKLLELRGCIVTIDAMGAQTAIAESILGQEADYVLALKANQGRLYSGAMELFAWGQANGFQGLAHQQTETVTKGHGRIETRRYYLITDLRWLSHLNEEARWAGLQSVGMVEAERQRAGAVEREVRYYISSLTHVADLARAVRGHWGSENGRHWVLDMSFGEDYSRNRKDRSAENVAVLRHIALNLLKQERSAKLSLRAGAVCRPRTGQHGQPRPAGQGGSFQQRPRPDVYFVRQFVSVGKAPRLMLTRRYLTASFSS